VERDRGVKRVGVTLAEYACLVYNDDVVFRCTEGFIVPCLRVLVIRC